MSFVGDMRDQIRAVENMRKQIKEDRLTEHCDICGEILRLKELIECMDTFAWTNSDGSKFKTINKDKLLDMLDRELHG